MQGRVLLHVCGVHVRLEINAQQAGMTIAQWRYKICISAGAILGALPGKFGASGERRGVTSLQPMDIMSTQQKYVR